MFEYEKKDVILKASHVSLTFDGEQGTNAHGKPCVTGGSKILKDINIEIKDIIRPGMSQGQIIGFLGPSGIGKTKFFEILSGIIPLDNKYCAFGAVELGLPLRNVGLGDMGVIQQNYPLFEHRTIYGNLDVAAKQKTPDKAQRKEKIMDILEKFDLDKRKDLYPAQLSGGQRQRAAIAQQILCSNHFLLMDEPFSGLDPIMVKKVSNLILDVSRMHELNTIIIVSHDISSTVALSDTLWVMGRDRDEKNEIIPGASIKYEYDLIERGLAWRPNIENTPLFHEVCDELKNLFYSL